jgi:hypothetical protein
MTMKATLGKVAKLRLADSTAFVAITPDVRPGSHRNNIPPLLFLVSLAASWVLFFAVWNAFPYIRSGANIVYEHKEGLERTGKVFPPVVPFGSRVIILGHSKVLAGFMPALFDSETTTAAGFPVYSFNMAKPAVKYFSVQEIDLLAKTHQLPRRILLALSWPTDAFRNTMFRFLQDDSDIIDTLFPFRKMPRDLVVFLSLAGRHGGPSESYRHSKNIVQEMDRNRGWYFIEGQSHYPGNQLPDDLHLPEDHPSLVSDPDFRPQGDSFQHLKKDTENLGIRIYIVPTYFREGEMAPAQAVSPVAERLKPFPHFTVVGPAYFLFPNRYFSDPVHLNPEGAQIYTRRLAELLAPVFARERSERSRANAF